MSTRRERETEGGPSCGSECRSALRILALGWIMPPSTNEVSGTQYFLYEMERCRSYTRGVELSASGFKLY